MREKRDAEKERWGDREGERGRKDGNKDECGGRGRERELYFLPSVIIN